MEWAFPDVIDMRGTAENDLLRRADEIPAEKLDTLLTVMGTHHALQSLATMLRDQPSLAPQIADALDKLADHLDKLADELKGRDP